MPVNRKFNTMRLTFQPEVELYGWLQSVELFLAASANRFKRKKSFPQLSVYFTLCYALGMTVSWLQGLLKASAWFERHKTYLCVLVFSQVSLRFLPQRLTWRTIWSVSTKNYCCYYLQNPRNLFFFLAGKWRLGVGWKRSVFSCIAFWNIILSPKCMYAVSQGWSLNL